MMSNHKGNESTELILLNCLLVNKSFRSFYLLIFSCTLLLWVMWRGFFSLLARKETLLCYHDVQSLFNISFARCFSFFFFRFGIFCYVVIVLCFSWRKRCSNENPWVLIRFNFKHNLYTKNLFLLEVEKLSVYQWKMILPLEALPLKPILYGFLWRLEVFRCKKQKYFFSCWSHI